MTELKRSKVAFIVSSGPAIRAIKEARVEILKQAVPQLRRLAVLSNTDHPGESAERKATEEAARALGLAVSYIPFKGGGELDGALSALRDAKADGVVVFPEGATMVARARIAQFAVAERLPSMFGWSEYADAGGLMSYGANQRDTYVRLAAFADKLLRGARPADVPIEQPTEFELVVNMKTAAALGITLPPATLLLAGRRIE